MSTTLEQSLELPWMGKTQEDINIDIKELKRPRYYNFRLASESSKASDDDTESIYSLQGKDTDVIRDTSDTESQNSCRQESEYEIDFEYEVAKLSDSEDVEVSTTDSEGMMLAAAAAVICNSSLEAWVTITDVEDSDSSTNETSFGRTDFSTCVQCKGENRNPVYRYCEKCFQNRKKCFPPRPRRNRRKNQLKPTENPVKLDTLRNCLSGLSQDSGTGSSQECPPLGMDKIVVPEHLQSPSIPTSEDISSDSSKFSETKEIQSHSRLKAFGLLANGMDSSLRRKRQSSESSLSDYEVKKPRLAPLTSDLGSEVSSISSFPTTITSFLSESSGFHSEQSGSSLSLEKFNGFDSDKSQSELCMFCNSAPKDSIFLHTSIAHRCCCYPCAKKTLKSIKRCPICNRSVNKVVKMFTS